MKQGTQNASGSMCCGLNRRRFLLYGTAAAVSCLLPAPIRAAVERVSDPERYLSFYSIHTHERLSICYYRQGAYQSEALKQINHILRDHRTNEIKPIDTRVLDFLHDISSGLRSRSPFHVISGYRSPTTNAMLRSVCKKVAPNSLHTKGKAIDIRLPECDTQKLRRFAINLRKGGVGYYKRKDFVHLDIGKIRSWQG